MKLTALQKMTMMGLAVGVNVADMLPEPKKPKEFTDADAKRLEEAKERRMKRNAKCLKQAQ